MLRKTVPVEIFTPSHRISGQLQATAQGLFSYLNLPTASGIDVEDASLCPLYVPWQEAEKIGSLWLVKSEISLVVVPSRGDLGVVGTARGGYTKPFPHRVRILLTGYEIDGLIEWPGKLDFSALVFEGDRPFIPAYESRLQALLFPQVRLETPAVLFNGKMVMGISQLHRKETQPLGPPPAES